MKVIVDRSQLFQAFQIAASVVPTRTTKPTLSNVKFDVTDQGATLTSTDQEIGLRVMVENLEVQAAGTVLIPVHRFGSILRESTDEKLSLESDGERIVVKGQRSQFRLPAENPDEFPIVATFDEPSYFEISSRLMKEIVRRTLFATDTESSRYALGGVLLEFEEDRLIAVGTDGRRLAKMEGGIRRVGTITDTGNMTIIPAKSMQVIDRSLTDVDADIQLAVHANDLLVRSPRVTIYSRLVEGRFPRWRDVLPQRTDATTIPLICGPLHSAVRQAAIVANEESRGLDFTFGAGNLVLSGSAADIGQARVEMPIAYEGEEISVSLDHRYVGEFLRALDPEKTISIELKDQDSAAKFETDDGYTYVVMPMARERV